MAYNRDETKNHFFYADDSIISISTNVNFYLKKDEEEK
jgi:hypothetical protein